MIKCPIFEMWFDMEMRLTLHKVTRGVAAFGADEVRLVVSVVNVSSQVC